MGSNRSVGWKGEIESRGGEREREKVKKREGEEE